MAYLHVVKTPEGTKSFFTPDNLYALDVSLAGGGHWALFLLYNYY